MPRSDRLAPPDAPALPDSVVSSDEERIEERRHFGEAALGELLLLRPNRFSHPRGGIDVAVLGALSLILVPVGLLALVRGVRCADQYRAVGLPAPGLAVLGGALGVAGTAIQIVVLYRLFLT